MAKFFGNTGASGRETSAMGESIARRSRRSRRGIGSVAEILSVDTGASGREISAMGKASHGGRGGHGGGIGLVAEDFYR